MVDQGVVHLLLLLRASKVIRSASSSVSLQAEGMPQMALSVVLTSEIPNTSPKVSDAIIRSINAIATCRAADI
jgi:hypothetical protein